MDRPKSRRIPKPWLHLPNRQVMTLTVCELERGPVEIVSFPIKNRIKNGDVPSIYHYKWWFFP